MTLPNGSVGECVVIEHGMKEGLLIRERSCYEHEHHAYVYVALTQKYLLIACWWKSSYPNTGKLGLLM